MTQPTPLDSVSTLYGAPLSLYTGRARSYLIKAGIPYRETMPITEHYLTNVSPLAGGRQSMPTLELPDGGVIRDGVAIIDHFEKHRSHEFSPTTPKQRIVRSSSEPRRTHPSVTLARQTQPIVTFPRQTHPFVTLPHHTTK